MNTNAKNGKIAQIIIGVLVGFILILTAVFMLYLIDESKATPDYTFSGNTLTISGMFGTDIDLTDATVTHELTVIPDPGTRTNGAAVGNILKGSFKMDGEKVYLNIMDKTAASYILITDSDGAQYYVNCKTIADTAALYQEIMTHVSQ